MIYAILITGAFLAWYKFGYLHEDPKAWLRRVWARIRGKKLVLSRDKYIENLVNEHYEECERRRIEAAAVAAELLAEKMKAKARKEEETRELARMEMEHRETLRAVYDRQYEELCEALEGANDKHRPVIGRKIDALDEKRFKNDLAIAKLSYKARG